VGYGLSGSRFVSSVAKLLFSGEHARVEASLNFGLGDWSMPEGMGFWDFKSFKQIDRDNSRYPVDKNDREMMQKGGIRVAEFSGGKWNRGVLKGLDFMYGHKDTYSLESSHNFIADDMTPEAESITRLEMLKSIRFPLRIRIPGTNAYVEVAF